MMGAPWLPSRPRQELACLVSSQASGPRFAQAPSLALGAHSELEPLSWILAGFDQVVIFLHNPFSIFLYKKKKKSHQLYRVAIGIKGVLYTRKYFTE